MFYLVVCFFGIRTSLPFIGEVCGPLRGFESAFPDGPHRAPVFSCGARFMTRGRATFE